MGIISKVLFKIIAELPSDQRMSYMIKIRIHDDLKRPSFACLSIKFHSLWLIHTPHDYLLNYIHNLLKILSTPWLTISITHSLSLNESMTNQFVLHLWKIRIPFKMTASNHYRPLPYTWQIDHQLISWSPLARSIIFNETWQQLRSMLAIIMSLSLSLSFINRREHRFFPIMIPFMMHLIWSSDRWVVIDSMFPTA